MKHVIYISGKPKLVLLHIRRLNSFKVSNKVKEYKNKIKTETKNFQLTIFKNCYLFIHITNFG